MCSTHCLSEVRTLSLSTTRSKVLLSVESPIISFKAHGVPYEGQALFTGDFLPKEISLKGSSKQLSLQRNTIEDLKTQLLLSQLLSSLPDETIKAQSSSITKLKEKDLFLMKGVVSTTSSHSPLSLTMKLSIFSDSVELSGSTKRDGIEFPPSSPLKILQGSIKGDAQVNLVFLR